MTGIADESSPSIASQIENHHALGWTDIELRNVDGQNVCEMPNEKFEKVYAVISEANFSVVSFDSAIANWARPITTDFQRDVGDLRRSIPRMRRLHSKYIRIMSYPNDGFTEKEWRDETFRRIRELTRIAEGEGVVLLLENCDGYASASPERLSWLFSTLDSPALKIVFDSGNPVSHGADEKKTMEFFEAALPWIAHFHIKDCALISGKVEHTYPGEGASGVGNHIRILLKRGYEGLFSIEPHMAIQVHLGGKPAPGVDQKGIYLKYGEKAWNLVLAALLAL